MFREAVRTLKKSFGVDSSQPIQDAQNTVSSTSHSALNEAAADTTTSQHAAHSLENIAFNLQHDQPLDQEIIL